MTVVDDHMAGYDEPQRSALAGTVAAIRATLPGAVEVISYGMPTFKLGGESGVAVVGLDGFTRHNSVFPYSGAVLTQFAEQLASFGQTKGAIHFAIDRPFPAPLLRRILKARIAEINATYPKKSGEMRAFYDNGFLKMSGKVKNGEMHGSWEWFRRDGSIMRAGSFAAGAQTGEWTTYDRAGEPRTVTRF